MKTKKSLNKKLEINKYSISNLNFTDQNAIKGGISGEPCDRTSRCPTYICTQGCTDRGNPWCLSEPYYTCDFC